MSRLALDSRMSRSQPAGAGGSDRAESSAASRRFTRASGANSLLRVGGLYKLESMVGFCDHRLDKRTRNPPCFSGAFVRNTPVVKG